MTTQAKASVHSSTAAFMEVDLEMGGRQPAGALPPKEGFAAVAEWIASDPDHEAFIYRKFNGISSRNLLYLQCEILFIESELQELDQRVSQSEDMTMKDMARAWEELVKHGAAGAREAKLQMELITKLREKIKAYRKLTLALPPYI